MSPIVEKEKELSEYLAEWITARYSEWRDFYQDTNDNRRSGIYLLKSGTELMDLFNSIMGNIQEHFCFEDGTHIIPSRFSSITHLLQFLENFNRYLKSHYSLIEQNMEGETTSMIVFELYRICYDIDQMVTRCQQIYQSENDIPIPYQQAKTALYNNNVKMFVEMVQSMIKSIPYNIHKEKLDEGYFHTIIHVITSLLGMSPISEVTTNDGRIDLMIEYPSYVYIMEFKYSNDGSDKSQDALKQIKDKEYAKAFYIKGKPIDGVGVSFSQGSRNIDHFVVEHLYSPSVSVCNKY